MREHDGGGDGHGGWCFAAACGYRFRGMRWEGWGALGSACVARSVCV